jgi:hypothetical protein
LKPKNIYFGKNNPITRKAYINEKIRGQYFNAAKNHWNDFIIPLVLKKLGVLISK